MRLLVRFLLLSIIVVHSGCSIQKRQHRSGWHLSWNQQYNSSEKNKQEEGVYNSTSAHVNAKHDKLTFSGKEKSIQHVESDTTDVFSKERNTKNQEKQSSELFPTSVNHAVEPSSTSNKNVIKQEKNKLANSLFSKKPDEEKEGHWFPRFLGGFFGVLVGLIAFIPLFFIVCLFFVSEGKVSDLTFTENESDGPMTRSFKKSYHAVFRVGLLFMIIALIFAAAALLIFIAYAALEIIGLILGIILTLLILLLFIKIWRELLDFLMFE